jgi:hypothetical protein
VDIETMDAKLHKYVGQRGDIDRTERVLFLNESQKELAMSFFFDSLETISDAGITTVDGTESYTPPVADYYIETMRNRTTSPFRDYPLSERDWDWYTWNHAEADEGDPEYWTMHGDLIYLHPTPDQIFTIRTAGRKLPVDMDYDAGTDTTLPEDWHLIIVLMAAVDLLFMYGNDARAITLKNEALGKIATRQEKRTLRRVRSTAQLSPGVVKPLGRGGRGRNRNQRDCDCG